MLSSYCFSDKEFQCYRCESGMSLFTWQSELMDKSKVKQTHI